MNDMKAMKDIKEAVHIRPAAPEDAKDLLEIYAPYVSDTAISFEYEVPSLEEFQKRILKISEKYPYLVAEKGKQILGYAYAGAFKGRAAYDWAVETSVYIRRDLRRSGLGRRLYETLEIILAAQHITNVEACITTAKIPDEYLTRDSLNFHEHMGYRLVGTFEKVGYKFGRWYGMSWMEKIIGEHEKNQQPVRRFSDISTEEIQALIEGEEK